MRQVKKEESKKYSDSFYRMPKVLFTNTKYQDITVEAKVLYALMLDRLALSKKNNWIDQDGNVYIFFTMQEAMRLLNVGHEKAVKLFAMLDQEKGVGLIRRKKLGQGKPAMIYVKELKEPADDKNKQNPKTPQNGNQTFCKSECNKTEENKNNGTSLSINPSAKVKESRFVPSEKVGKTDELEYAVHYEEIVKENIEQDVLLERHPYDQETIRGIADLITDTVTSRRKTIRLDCQDIPQEIVKSRFLKLNFCHIEYILEHLTKNMTKIRNFRSYLLTALYNAPATMSAYYSAAVSYGMSTGFA